MLTSLHVWGPTLPVAVCQDAAHSSYGTHKQAAQSCKKSGEQGSGSASARVTINLISVNPSVGSRITPVTTRLVCRLHLCCVSAADLQTNAMAGGTMSMPAPACFQEVSSPTLPTPALWPQELQGQAGGDSVM